MSSSHIIVTGPPGSGKTLWVLSKLVPTLKLTINDNGDRLEVDRPIYYSNIPDLTIPAMRCENPREWFKLPAGSVLIVDEAQKIWPTRPTGSKVPDDVMQMTTGRHLGITIVFITQNGKMLDHFIRDLCNDHAHVFRALLWKRATIFRWSNYEESWKSKAARDSAIKSNFVFDKNVYKVYKSSDLHVDKPRIPKIFAMIPLAAAAVAFGLYATYNNVKDIGNATDQQTAKTKQFGDSKFGVSSGGSSGASPIASGSSAAAKFDPRDPAGLSAQRLAQEQIAGKPWLEPRFADLVKPQRAPVPVACIARSEIGRCQCYTEDMTVIRDVDQAYCRSFAEGYEFASWRKPREEARGGAVEPRGARTAGVTAPIEVKAEKPAEANTYTSFTIPPGAPVTGHRSSDWSVPPKYQ